MASNLRQVFIAVPAYDGRVCCDFAVGVAEIFRLAESEGFELYLRFWMYDSLVHIARNSLMTEAYEQGVDDCVFIDADQSFSPESFFAVLNHPVDVIGLPVRNKDDINEQYNIRPHEVERHKYDLGLKLLEVEAIGTGFLRLSRRAMTVLRDASPAYGDNYRMICNTQIIEGGLIGEDIQICDKIRAAGLKVYADIEYTCDHFGIKRFTGSYKTHYISELTRYKESQTKENTDALQK